MKRVNLSLILIMLVFWGCVGPGEVREWEPEERYVEAYDWGEWDEKPPALAAFQKEYPELDSLVKDTMHEVLVSKGYKYDSKNPDCLVYYYFTIEELTTVRSRHTRYGSVGTMPEFRQYEEGRLIIDVVDIKRNDMIWYGDAGDVIEESLTDEKRKERVQFLIRKVLQEVPEVE